MSTSTRNDIHRPSVMIPADYELACEYTSYTCEDDWGNKYTETEGYAAAQIAYAEQPVAVHSADIDRCDLCGAHHGTGAIYQHVPSGDMLSIGWQCAEKVELAAAFTDVAKVKADLRHRALQRVDRVRRRRGVFAWGRANRELLPLLRVKHDIAKEMRVRLILTGAKFGLSQKQVALLERLAQDVQEVHVPVPHAMNERVEITGRVVSIKTTTGYYGDQTRMTVKVDTNLGSYLVNGSAPAALFEASAQRLDDTREERHQARMAELRELKRQRDAGEITAQQFEQAEVEWDVRNREAVFTPPAKGATVTFRAVLQPSDNAHFAFFKRPTKFEVISWPDPQV